MLKIPILRQLYFLQLENYNLPRYWKVVFRYGNGRGQIVWTAKAAVIFGLTIILALIFVRVSGNLVGSIIVLTAIAGLNILAAAFLSLAVIILWPLDWAIKRFVIQQAKQKLGQFSQLKIIGITGSFGKTTMKEALAAVLGVKFRVLKTPENINTPLGVARLIKNQLNDSVEILIVEMGAYRQGDIRRLCDLTPPDIAVLTGINEAHLERFGSIANTIRTKFEIVQHSSSAAAVFLNQDNEPIKQNYRKYLGSREVIWYNDATLIRTALLGSYAAGVVNACALIGKHLGLTEEEITEGIKRIEPIPHRLQLIPTSNGITVIDDSYNGNPDGAHEAIKVLAGFKDKRKIYLTPGLVEMGSRTQAVHKAIGQELAAGADVVMLIKNSVTPFIAQGLADAGFPAENIWWFNSSREAHARMAALLQPGDVIVFQNDWPENYV